MSELPKHPNLVTYKFSDAFLNTFDRTLSKNGKQLEVFAKTFDLLLLLVKNAGEVVTKDHILDTIWKESFVEEQNLTVHISKLRKLLEANIDEPFIKTIKGKGYQFVSPVEVITNIDKNNSSEIGNDDNVKSESIAILPLINENGDDEVEYLADGLTESLINSLSYMKNFKVSARDSVFHYKDKSLKAQEIGKKLKVSKVLTGRLRVFKDNLIIGLELINVSDGTQIWGKQINEPFSGIFKMQDKLTFAISESLKIGNKDVVINPIPILERITENTESYKLYLKGKHFRDNCGYEEPFKAIKCFKKSILEDPKNAHSYIALGESYYWSYVCDYKAFEEVSPLIYKNLEIAIKLNPNIPELYLLKGMVSMSFEWSFSKAEESFQKAFNLNPNYIEAYYSSAHLLIILGDFSKAQLRLNETTRLTSVTSKNLLHLSRLFHHTGQYEKAIGTLEEILEFEPMNSSALSMLSFVLSSMGKYEEAILAVKRSLDIKNHYGFVASLGYAQAKVDKKTEAYKIIDELTEKSKERYIPPTYNGIIYAALGETDLAFKALEQACEQKEADIIKLKIDPRFSSLKDDPRFDELLRRIGLL